VPFTSLWQYTRNISLTGPDGAKVHVISPMFNRPTPVGGITASVVGVPGDNKTATTGPSGCLDAHWTGVDAKGKVALVGGGCSSGILADLAQKYGAAALLIQNSRPGTNYIVGGMYGNQNRSRPAVGVIPLEEGTAWRGRSLAGQEVKVTFLVESESGMRESWNVIAETKEGDPNSIVMLGAHLDSVPRGPGINDDGSGSAALIEIANSFKKYKGFKNKVRFGWWGAEENGLIGSSAYVANLSETERNKLRFYFNYDMIGSINPKYYVGKHANSRSVVPDMLAKYLQERGKNTTWE
jgi:aminopeptidase Y